MKYYKLNVEESLNELDSQLNGLSSADIKRSIKKHGTNTLEEKTKKNKAQVFLEQFQDVLVIILIISAVIAIFTNELESAIVIFIVITINALIGTVQYFKAEKSLESLRKLSNPQVLVIRDSEEQYITSDQIVVGDIVKVKSGDVISADGRVILSNSLEINESSLTGESTGVEKHSDAIAKDDILITEQANMLFSSSKVIKGSGMYVVTEVGMKSEIGRIASMMDKVKPHKSPLERSLDEFSKYLAIIIIIICLGIFIVNLYRHISFIDSLMFSVSLAVAAIPEALGAIVTIVLALGTKELAKHSAIIKDIKAVETLGSINVICTDKTGTLTMNQLMLSGIYIDKKFMASKMINTNIKSHYHYLNCLMLCNSIDSINIADPIEKAIYDLSIENHYELLGYKKKYPINKQLSFDSKRKMMTTIHGFGNHFYTYTKGAPEIIIKNSKKIIINNTIKEISDLDRYQLISSLNKYTGDGCRVIGLGYKEKYDNTLDYNDEKSLIFLGFLVLLDPPRKEAKEAVLKCLQARVMPVMITGDNELTAKSIAKQVGIYHENDLILNGEELDKISDEQLLNVVNRTTVYARVTPEHKIRIVDAFQKNGKIVAMTGDGVNDSPALKRANVGIAMGESGTEVAKDASSMILVDDNFNTIVSSISIGRKIFANIQNAIRFLIAGNAAGIFIVLVTTIFLLPIPFAPVHLLFINLLTDSFPAIAIGMEKGNNDYLSRPPRNPKSKILSKKVFKKTIFEAFLISCSVLGSYFIGLLVDQYYARTMAFLTLCLTRLIYSINCRGENSIFKHRLDNKFMIYSLVFGFILLILVINVPLLQTVLLVSKLNIREMLIILGLSIFPTLIIQLSMILKRK